MRVLRLTSKGWFGGNGTDGTRNTGANGATLSVQIHRYGILGPITITDNYWFIVADTDTITDIFF